MREIRSILIYVFGTVIVLLTYKSKYQVSSLYSAIWAVSMLIWVLLSVWTATKDIISYREEKELRSFSLTIVCAAFTIAILIMENRIQSEFNKSTLVKVYYDGDINGTGIDFKVDGTYIFENAAIGIVDYQYGTYSLDDDVFTLDRKEIDNVIEADRLILADKEKEKYLMQIDNNGQVIDAATEFRVTIDNR